MRVSVIGGSSIDDTEARIAEAVGRELADRGHTVVCGGLGGTMAAVCRGARTVDDPADTIGILPGERRSAANRFVTVPIATGLGHARNALVIQNGDAVIALSGGAGTLSEIGMAGVYDRPIAGLGTHDLDGIEALERFEPVATPNEAVTAVESAVDDDRN
ncbi:TIGR00725 family protein [Halopenitus persicus]|uniref:TIGR00725 family protein n=1 Tax=Halopenitus persicus TaxID=1048396 RepID=UPI000BBAD9F2|nr:TIGR00725 family protein [Halopenitus persicus]